MTSPPRDLASRPRVAALLALTGVAASVDAISYLGLGRVFPANMTGNTVLLAIGLAGRDFQSAARSACALGGFVLGAAAAAAARPGPGSTRPVAAVLGIEVALLLTVAAWWTSLGTAPHSAPRYTLIVLASLAMGAQSATVTTFDAAVSTTYITGTWTSISSWLGHRLSPGRRCSDQQRAHDRRVQCAVLGCYFGVAVACGYLFHAQSTLTTAIPVAASVIAWPLLILHR